MNFFFFQVLAVLLDSILCEQVERHRALLPQLQNLAWQIQRLETMTGASRPLIESMFMKSPIKVKKQQ